MKVRRSHLPKFRKATIRAVKAKKTGLTRQQYVRYYTNDYNFFRKFYPQKLDRIFPLVRTRYKRNNTKWDCKSVLELAKKYKNRREFARDYNGAYNFLSLNGLLFLLDPVLPSKLVPKYNWKKIKEDCKYLSDISIKYPAAYSYLKRHKLLHMLKLPMKPKPKYVDPTFSLEKALEEAKKSSYSEFIKTNTCRYLRKYHLEEIRKIFPNMPKFPHT